MWRQYKRKPSGSGPPGPLGGAAQAMSRGGREALHPAVGALGASELLAEASEIASEPLGVLDAFALTQRDEEGAADLVTGARESARGGLATVMAWLDLTTTANQTVAGGAVGTTPEGLVSGPADLVGDAWDGTEDFLTEVLTMVDGFEGSVSDLAVADLEGATEQGAGWMGVGMETLVGLGEGALGSAGVDPESATLAGLEGKVADQLGLIDGQLASLDDAQVDGGLELFDGSAGSLSGTDTWLTEQTQGEQEAAQAQLEGAARWAVIETTANEAIGLAVADWAKSSRFEGIELVGPVMIGAAGCLTGDDMAALVQSATPWADWGGEEGATRDAIAEAFGAAWSTWQDGVTVPGLPVPPGMAVDLTSGVVDAVDLGAFGLETPEAPALPTAQPLVPLGTLVSSGVGAMAGLGTEVAAGLPAAQGMEGAIAAWSMATATSFTAWLAQATATAFGGGSRAVLGDDFTIVVSAASGQPLLGPGG